MVFLPGDHALDTDITVANASYLTIIGMSSLTNVAKIACNGSVGISFTDIVDFKMYSLTFMSCSRKLAHSPVCNYALLLQSTQYAELVNCSFCDNLGDQEQRTAPRRSEVGVAPEVTWNVGGALRSLGHVFRSAKEVAEGRDEKVC